MGLLNNRVSLSKIKPGDHIYTYRAAFIYSHHGIYAGGYQVIHFTQIDENSSTATSVGFSSSSECIPSSSSTSSDFSSSSASIPSCCSSTATSFSFSSSSECIPSSSSTSSSFSCSSASIPSSSSTSSDLSNSSASIPSCCPNILRIRHCGIRQPGSGVVLSCLDCFLGKGALRYFDYGVSALVFLLRVRGGTCTRAKSDPSNVVLHRAMYLLLNGFGKYDLVEHNCEDFALYCKTSLVITKGLGTTGQASSVLFAPSALIHYFPLKFLLSNPMHRAVASAGIYHFSRFGNDIGVRSDVKKVPVEKLVA